MLKGLTFLPAAAFAFGLAFATGANADHHANTVVAKINGEEITIGHMIVARMSLPDQYKELPDDVLFNALLDQMIQQTVLKQQLHGEVPTQVKLRLDNESRGLLAATVIEGIMETGREESLVREAYEARYSTGDGGDEFNASHILVETEERANEIKAEAETGLDFATLAKEYSTGPSGPNGGQLGWFGTGRMVPEFEAAVVEMQPGDISKPVETQFGWHVIRLNDRRKISAPEFDEVKEQIAQELAIQAVEDRVNQLTADADIQRPEIEDFDPAVLRDGSLVRD
ncbi:Foldase protein PrsA 3 precursor [Tritonibacter multivorans]|uniref:Parvulin-like PPIase n=1 Tax=Tritonibacter multivorans TaxID=928856 RepID=A0A0N7M060_9RHOB|nr:peptidylprolyl isomerase [Tritonibacter multivorans]MDA7420036.1 peptidylprolyl isomerase [Tritonibacter multivorans]CUH79561.1 Foldase protein PrsA 3 precursor [Tritonibacter multivorans]SFC07193.1 peptidyl-prolyl cis-trans isomerase C [Tritonibacter multivorans]